MGQRPDPPVASITLPVTQRASSEARNATTPAMSSASLYAVFGDKRSLVEESVAAYGWTSAGSFMGKALEEPTACGAFARILREAARIYADPSHPAGCLTIRAAINVTPRDAEVGARLRGLRNADLVAWEAVCGPRGVRAGCLRRRARRPWPGTSRRSSRACRSDPATGPTGPTGPNWRRSASRPWRPGRGPARAERVCENPPGGRVFVQGRRGPAGQSFRSHWVASYVKPGLTSTVRFLASAGASKA